MNRNTLIRLQSHSLSHIYNPQLATLPIMTPSKALADPTQHTSGQANNPLSLPAHALSQDTLISEIKADADDGLSTSVAKSRLQDYGPNELGDDAGVNLGKILLRQVANAMTLVLILAMAVSFGIQSWIEGEFP